MRSSLVKFPLQPVPKTKTFRFPNQLSKKMQAERLRLTCTRIFVFLIQMYRTCPLRVHVCACIGARSDARPASRLQSQKQAGHGEIDGQRYRIGNRRYGRIRDQRRVQLEFLDEQRYHAAEYLGKDDREFNTCCT